MNNKDEKTRLDYKYDDLPLFMKKATAGLVDNIDAPSSIHHHETVSALDVAAPSVYQTYSDAVLAHQEIAPNEPEKMSVAHLTISMQVHSTEHIIRTLVANKMGRSATDNAIKDMADYIMMRSSSVLKPEAEEYDGESLDELLDELQKVAGVSTQVVYEDLPETATIIVKINGKILDNDEIQKVPLRVNNVITAFKPKALTELEVIFHHKEVY